MNAVVDACIGMTTMTMMKTTMTRCNLQWPKPKNLSKSTTLEKAQPLDDGPGST